ncbi:Ketoreductase azaE [Cladobotryum mycophilum]|uniref:Ketoreductase azaE n=1 Tax=Cladobotryum mycophilum TaxID=491253 RepID=A0ABR0T0F0_9HYPO
MTKVLLTGGSGFIAAHILQQLLSQGHTVTTTVRSPQKALPIHQAHPEAISQSRLHVLVVPDIAQPSAFDRVLEEAGRDLDVVLHTASPFHFSWTDAQTELIDPALNGTRGILLAVKKYAPQVRRVVITSSFAALMDEDRLEDGNHVFSETSWNPDGLGDINRSKATAYRVSKTMAEQAAWAFIKDQNPTFDLVTICPPMVYGPVAHFLPSLDAINTSNGRLLPLLQGEWKAEIPGTGPVPIWVDVRDCARAHVLAMDLPQASGQRLFTAAGRASNHDIARIVREHFPEYADRLPGPEVRGGEMPAPDQTFGFDNKKTVEILGFEWTSIEKCVIDIVNSLKEHGL